jgi:hypothetical protein
MEAAQQVDLADLHVSGDRGVLRTWSTSISLRTTYRRPRTAQTSDQSIIPDWRQLVAIVDILDHTR